MTSIYQNTLAIPESTVQGSGGYTMPANKYGEIAYYNLVTCQMKGNCYFSSGQTFWVGHASVSLKGAFDFLNSRAEGRQALVAGDTVTVQTNAPVSASYNNNLGAYVSQNSNGLDRSPYSRLLINGVIVGQAKVMFRASHNVSNGSNNAVFQRHQTEAIVGWGVAEFPIPKNNLPPELIEGN